MIKNFMTPSQVLFNQTKINLLSLGLIKNFFVMFFILVFLALGTWQIIRLNWKLELINSIEQSLKSEPIEFNGSNPTNFKKIKFEQLKRVT